ncbi:MAG: twin-arginine translocase TatA/TatE family subunit [Crenarchaeota archaeon]|nr:twin-arginine translocase TatA/TatE family subunit [Thermoproteota archaeon]
MLDLPTLALIVIAIAILLIWGPSKLPSLARAIGQAIHEFKRGTKGLVEEEESETAREKKTSLNDKEKIMEIAKKLGIDTTGKSLDEIIAEIESKLSQVQASK